MSNHRQITDRGPSLFAITLDFAVCAAALTGVVWIARGAEIGSGQVVGTALGIVLSCVMMGNGAEKIAERTYKLRRAERERVQRLAGPAPQSYEAWMASVGPMPKPLLEAPRLLTPEEESDLQADLRTARARWTEVITEVMEAPQPPQN